MVDLNKILKEKLSLTDDDIKKYETIASKNKKNMFLTLSKHSSINKVKLLKVLFDNLLAPARTAESAPPDRWIPASTSNLLCWLNDSKKLFLIWFI